MADNEKDDDALVSRLRLIEDRPLAERAAGYGRVHAELVEALEGHDVPNIDE